MFRSNSADPWRRRDTVHGVSRTLYQVLRETAARYGDAPALRQPKPGQPAYATCSWNDYRRAAEEIAAGLRRLGLAKGDTVALNSETRMEFYLADMGILLRMVPGLQVARIDASSWSVTARGFGGRFADKMLVLIDGRSIYNHLYSGV